MAAAVSAREQGANRVAILERAPRELRGGNTHYSGGLLRFAYESGEDLLPLVPDVEQQVPGFLAGVESYPQRRFRADLDRVTEGRSDPELSEIHSNYPGGTGLMSGAVFGRIAGANAAGA